MSLRTLLKCAQFVYFIFGQAPQPIALSNRFPEKFRKLWRFIPSCVMVYSVFLATMQSVLLVDFYYKPQNWADQTFDKIRILMYTMLILVIILQSQRLHQKWPKMNDIFVIIADDLQKNLHTPFNIALFGRDYGVQTVIILLLAACCYLPEIFVNHNVLNWRFELAYSFYRLYKYLITLHVSFYVSLVNALIGALKRIGLEHDEDDVDKIAICDRSRGGAHLLIHYRHVHYKLCAAANFINDIFGWTIFLLIIITMYDFIYVCYRVFYFVERNETIYTIRMYKYLF